MTSECSEPAAAKPLKLGTMIPSGRRYKSTASDFNTPDVHVQKYTYRDIEFTLYITVHYVLVSPLTLQSFVLWCR